jgi:serine-type D-Ala-D-Ala carboxypeptidase/endopeptidase
MKINSAHPNLWSPMQRLLFLILLILLMLLIIATKGYAQSKEPSFMDKVATAYVNDARNHALVIGIIQNGKQSVFTYGEVEKGEGERPTPNSLFELGNTSEIFTTSLLALLEAEGKVSSLEPVESALNGQAKIPYYQRIICLPKPMNNPPDAPNAGYDRGNICYPDPDEAPLKVVLCDLATHSAGLPATPYWNIFELINPYAKYTTEKLNRFVSDLPPNQAFGYQYQHSLIGIALLGEALTVKTGKDYATLLKEHILTPLSMTHTFIVPTPEQTALFLDGHTSKGRLTHHRDYNALTPAAGIRSSVHDLLHFLDAHLKTTTRFNTALKDTHTPRIYTDFNNRDYMVGWSWLSKPITDKSKKRLYWISNKQGGFANYIGFIPENNLGIVILSNSANRVDDIGEKLLKYLQNTMATASSN